VDDVAAHEEYGDAGIDVAHMACDPVPVCRGLPTGLADDDEVPFAMAAVPQGGGAAQWFDQTGIDRKRGSRR